MKYYFTGFVCVCGFFGLSLKCGLNISFLWAKTFAFFFFFKLDHLVKETGLRL